MEECANFLWLRIIYSQVIFAGGLFVMSKYKPSTKSSFLICSIIFSKISNGIFANFAVVPSSEVTGRKTIEHLSFELE